jgi:hypothetical protein
MLKMRSFTISNKKFVKLKPEVFLKAYEANVDNYT